MSESIGTSLALGLIKSVVYIYDIITFPIYFVVQKPWEKTQKSKAIRAKQESNDPFSPWASLAKPKPHFVDECKTVSELFSRAAQVYGDRQCFGKRQLFGEEDEVQSDGKVFKKFILGDYHWYSYREIDERVDYISRGLIKNGVRPSDIVMIFAETRLEWMMSAQAIFRIGATVGTLYATIGNDGIIHGINETEVTHIITSHDLLPKLQHLMSRIPRVQCIIYMESYKPPQLEGFDSKINVLSLSQIEESGKDAKNLKGEAPRPESTAVLMYTSGSTGIPKGVMITHKNLLVTIRAFFIIEDKLKDKDIYMALLPLAHVLELAAELFFYSVGGSIGYATPLTLTDKSTGIKKGCSGDAPLLKPTVMAVVPLILDRVRKGVGEQIDQKGKFSKALFNFAINYKRFWTRKGFETPIINLLIFNKIKAMLGGRVRILACGAAPLSPDTHEFSRLCLDLHLIQGYGLTETASSATLMDCDDMSIGRVGAPLNGIKIKLVNWIEGGYRVTDRPHPRGEIVVGGDNITAGYFKNEALTQECYKEEDGIQYFYTGDIGEAFPDGTFKIIDRKKDLVKLQFGEYISLGKIEAELKSCPFVDNICVYGDSFHTYLIAMVVPNARALENLSLNLGKEQMTQIELCRDPKIISEITKAITEHGLNSKLHKMEIPTKIKLCSDEWLPESGLVTAALKLKRKNIQDYYQNDINEMYDIESGISKST